MIAFQEEQSLFRVAMQTLFYPAVLGSIIYSVFGNFENIDEVRNHLAFVVMMLSVITFFCIDFLTTYLKSTYSSIGIISDVLVIGLMFTAFESINFVQHSHIRLILFCECMSATFLLFVIVDYVHRDAYKNYIKRILFFEIFLTISFGLFAVVRFTGKEWWVAGLSAATAAAMVIIFSKMYREHYSGLESQTVATEAVIVVTQDVPLLEPKMPLEAEPT